MSEQVTRPQFVIVSFCTNDEHGNDTGKVCAVHLDDGAIELQWGEIGSEPTYRIVGSFLWLQRRRYDIGGIRTWYGNWCWTGIALKPTEAAKLLNNLTKDDRWHCEGGWCDLSDAFVAGEVTPEMLLEVSR